MNTYQDYPQTLAEALSKGEALMTDADKAIIQTRTLLDSDALLHMTLGHTLRNELGLWNESATLLFDDINQRMPDQLAIDADTASSALISAIWHAQHGLRSWR